MHVGYNTDANTGKRSYSAKILEIGMILGEKIEQKVYVNQENLVSDIYTTTD